MEQTLYKNEFIAVINRDEYFFCREVRSNSTIVAILPFRLDSNRMPESYMARLEICPAHSPSPEICCITGGVEHDELVEVSAWRELMEETGYNINQNELIALGIVRPSKSSDVVAHLFAVDVTDKTRSLAQGDGTLLEQSASVEWVNYEIGIQIKDPLFITAITRLMASNLSRST